MERNEDTIDLMNILREFIRHIWLAVILTLLGAVAAGVYTFFFVTPMYTSSALIYVENRNSATTSSDAINLNDINAAQKLVSTCEIIFKNTNVMEAVKTELGLSMSNNRLMNMISIASVNDTEVMQISTVADSPELAYNITNSLLGVVPAEFNRVIEAGTIKTVEPASFPTSQSSPNIAKNIVMGAGVGFVLAAGIVVLISLLDKSVKPDDDLFRMYNIPVFAEIADIEYVSSKHGGKGGYGYGEKK